MLYFALKFQQLTGPVMAKGVEDTAFYVYTRFLSSNEVGGSAKSFGISLDALHQSNQGRLKHSPDSMLTTSPTTPSAAKMYAIGLTCSLNFPSPGRRRCAAGNA